MERFIRRFFLHDKLSIRPRPKPLGIQFVEPPQECLFWAENNDDFVNGNKEKWRWKQMIVTNPEWISDEIFETLVGKVEKKLGPAPNSKLKWKV